MAAAPAVGSRFSAAAGARLIRSKILTYDAPFKLACLPKSPPTGSAIAYSLPLDLGSICVASREWRSRRRIGATVAEEGVAAAAETEDVEEVKGGLSEEGEEAGEAPTATEDVEEEKEGLSEEGEEAEEAPTATTKLYFGNLPYNVDSAQLAAIIQDYASPEMVEVLYDRDTGRSRGFAFVTMSSIEDCNAVIENLDGSECGGRTLRVNFADKPKPKIPLYPETEFKIFVGNLAWTTTSDSLTQVFQEYGNVVGARVLYDGETGRSRGYGFVSYSTQEEMDAALQYLNGVELAGRAMRVSPAEGKKS